MLGFPKPAKGTVILERRDKRAAIRTHETTEKAKVVKRDGMHSCRLIPGCIEKEKHETAHVFDKGMGGDHGHRSDASLMLRACLFHHRGSRSMHSGDIRVELLTERGTDGPIEVWMKDERGGWFMCKREVACNVSERD